MPSSSFNLVNMFIDLRTTKLVAERGTNYNNIV